MDQRPAPQVPLGGLPRPVEVLGAVQGIVETPLQPVHEVARPVAAGVVVRPDERPPLGAGQRPSSRKDDKES